MSALEDFLAAHIRYMGLPEPQRQYKFSPSRRWKFDFCWPDKMLAVEVDGGTWTGGRHTRGAGFQADCEKLNAAVIAGFRVLRFTGKMIRSGEALVIIEAALGVD